MSNWYQFVEVVRIQVRVQKPTLNSSNCCEQDGRKSVEVVEVGTKERMDCVAARPRTSELPREKLCPDVEVNAYIPLNHCSDFHVT